MSRSAALLMLWATVVVGVPQGLLAQTRGPIGRPIIIFIHGRGQAWTTGSELETLWFSSFADGLETLAPNARSEPAFHSMVPSQDRRLVRYERVYEPGFQISAECGGVSPDPSAALASQNFKRIVAIEQLQKSLPGQETASTGQEEKLMRREVLDVEKANQRLFEAQSKAVSTKTVNFAPLISNILRKIRDAASRMFGAGPGLAFTEDTALYLEKGGHYCETNLRLRNALDDAVANKRPIVMVAHSMGAMVTLDQLWHSFGVSYNIVRFISVGAQLGLPDLLRYLAGAGASHPLLPKELNNWVNIRGKNDLLGFTIDASTVQLHQGGSLMNKEIDTGTMSEAHSVSHYLQARLTANAIADAYCRAFPAGISAPPTCTQIPKF